MKYDVIIIGGGPAGLSAGIYAARGALKTLILENGPIGGQVTTTWDIENYPGTPIEIIGPDLVSNMHKQCEHFGVEFALEEYHSFEKKDGGFEVTTSKGLYFTKSIIVATGVQPKLLGCVGENEHRGMGVSYCATCDANFFQNLHVAVIGGGDAALEEALYLTKFASKVTIIHRRDRFRGAEILVNRVKMHPQIEIVWDSEVEEIAGKPIVNEVTIKNVKDQSIQKLAVDGVFIFVGQQPNTEKFDGILEMNESGYLIGTSEMKTNIEGVFVAGDVREKMLRQVVTATADGAIAAMSAIHYIENL